MRLPLITGMFAVLVLLWTDLSVGQGVDWTEYFPDDPLARPEHRAKKERKEEASAAHQGSSPAAPDKTQKQESASRSENSSASGSTARAKRGKASRTSEENSRARPGNAGSKRRQAN